MLRFASCIGIVVVALFASLPAYAQLVPGRDYVQVRLAQPVADPSKIEVREYFSWGCSHCYQLYPHLMRWKNQCPADVQLVQSAVSVGFEQWVPLTRAFYALDATGDLPRIDAKIFRAIHEQRINLFGNERLIDWLAAQGIDKTYLGRVMGRDMTIDRRVREAEASSRSIPISGTPTLIVDGKYLLVGAAAKSYADWMPLLDHLIAMARADRLAARKLR
jgi:protein dithiol oxidoreductase (disulfide-forming)